MATKSRDFGSCVLCDVKFKAEQDSALHFTSRRHIRVLEYKSSVYFRVTGMDFRNQEDKQEIAMFASQFGKVKNSYADLRGSWMVVHFDELTSANKILAKPKDELILGNGKKITAIGRKKHRTEYLKEAAADMKKEISEIDLQKISKNCFSVEEQISELMKEIDDQITEEDDMRRQAVCDELLDALTVYLPHTTLEMFGSSVNGLGLKGSDIDVSVFFNLDKYDETSGPCISKKSFPLMDDPDIKTVNLQNTETREINVQGLKDLVNSSRANAIVLVSRLIGSENTGFTKLVNRTGGRVPVIKAHHGGTNIPCDIVCDNRLGIRNSQLLKLYQDLDPRVKPLLRTLRLLGGRIGFSGSIVSKSPKMTHYCLYMMVVFYLQNTQPPVLPTVEELANLAEGSDRVIANSYNASYTSDLSKIRRPTNYSSLQKLLCDFFMFFVDFDFSYYVICPRTGKVVPILEIDQFCEFQEGLTFKPKVIHIQDPFVLDQNIAGNTNKFILDLMLSAFRKCSQLILEPTFGEPTLTRDWGLTALASTGYVDSGEESDNKANDKVKVSERTLPDGRQMFRFSVPLAERHIKSPFHCFQPLTHRANLIALKQWFTYRTVNAILGVLEGPFLGTVIPEAENLEDLVSEYHSLEAQRLKLKRSKVKDKPMSNNGRDGPPSKRFKTETGDEDAAQADTVIPEKQPQKNQFGVFYSPVEKEVATNIYDIDMQQIFSPEQYGKKQLLYSAECKLFSRTDDYTYSRNKIRAQLVENEGLEHIFNDTEQFCAFETKVTKRALNEVMKTRSKKIPAVYSEPTMEFHTHISVVNNLGEQLSIEVEMEDDLFMRKSAKEGFGEPFVHNFATLLMKIVKNYPLL